MDILAAAAVLLSLERFFYVWLCRAPQRFVALCRPAGRRGADPITGVQVLFYGFKAVQIGVIAWWCVEFGNGRVWPLSDEPALLATGGLLIVAGQFLNVAVFKRLGRVGVFYGGQFGSGVPWRSGFPFSWFRHPQYVGAVATVWGVFLVLRYPAPDWIYLPLLESAYYWLSSKLERYDDHAARVNHANHGPLASEN